ncbi:MAG: stage 0 sporulation protein, partial [Ruminococcaceae bacterium]|nr:stage 0 sporulation protein [Oscillospiraceae bacterium]
MADEILNNNEEIEVIGIRFKDGGKVYYFDPNGCVAKSTDYAVVETSRGIEFGKVACTNKKVSSSEVVPPLRPVIRIATENDIKVNSENKKKETDAIRICQEKVASHKLEMKLIEAEYTFDGSKLTFYFTVDGRIDFRDLVKDLASTFRTRIELRQIGIRDEAKLMGGLGVCGRPFCCNTFLPDFCQVSIKMAKEQS